MATTTKPATRDPMKPGLGTLTLFLFPTVFLLSVFLIWPIIESFKLSLVDWNGIDKVQKPIQFGNWIELFHDVHFWMGVRNSFILLIVSIVVQIPVALFLSVLLYRGGKRFRFFKITYFFPFLMSTVAIGILFKQIFDTNLGALNEILGLFHLYSLQLDWLGQPNVAIITVCLLVSWQYIPFYTLLFLAALNGISNEVEEAASLDGVEKWKLARTIQIPLIRGAIITSITLICIGSLKYFDLIWVMTGGGPVYSTSTMATYLYELAFKSYRVGYGSTVASALFIIVFFVAMMINTFTKRVREN